VGALAPESSALRVALTQSFASRRAAAVGGNSDRQHTPGQSRPGVRGGLGGADRALYPGGARHGAQRSRTESCCWPGKCILYVERRRRRRLL